MEKILLGLESDLWSNVGECERFAKANGRKGKYVEAIQLLAMADAYKQIAHKIRKILNEGILESDAGANVIDP